MYYFDGTNCVEETGSLPPAGAVIYSSLEECGQRHFTGEINLNLIKARKAQMIESAKRRKEQMGTRQPCGCGQKKE